MLVLTTTEAASQCPPTLAVHAKEEFQCNLQANNGGFLLMAKEKSPDQAEIPEQIYQLLTKFPNLAPKDLLAKILPLCHIQH